MEVSYRILATAPIEAMDEERPVPESEWRALAGRSFIGDGLSFADETSFSREYVDEEAEARPLLSGGFLRFEMAAGLLLAMIEFRSPRPLTEVELKDLGIELEATLWDGLGDSIRWDNDLGFVAFGEVTLTQDLIEPKSAPGAASDRPI